MAKLEIPVMVDISEIKSLIDEIKHLQTYKLFHEDEHILINRDDVVKIFAGHVRANIVPENGGDYLWNDNHGKLIRCKDCVHSPAAHDDCPMLVQYIMPEGYCHLGKGKDE